MNDGGRELVDEGPPKGERGRGSAVGVPLFRPEVLRHQQSEWLGTILVKPRAMNWWFAGLAALTALAILLLLFAASYTRKAKVSGWLVPQQGMVRVFAPRAAVVTSLLVREGAQVKQGQPLAQLSTEEQSAALGDTQAGTVRSLEEQRATLEVERLRAQEMVAQQRAALTTRYDTLGREADSLRQEIEVQQKRLALAQQWQQRLGGCRAAAIFRSSRCGSRRKARSTRQRSCARCNAACSRSNASAPRSGASSTSCHRKWRPRKR